MAWLSGWDKRIELTLDSVRVDQDLTDFPVMIHLASGTGISSADVTDIFDTLLAGSPTTSYSTWSTDAKSAAIDLTNGNLTATATNTAWKSVKSMLGVSSGKWYWEITIDVAASVNTILGVGTDDASVDNYTGVGTSSYGYHAPDGNKYNNGVVIGYGASYTAGDIISVALDMDNGKLWWAKNDTWQASGDPGAGTNEAYSGLTGTFYAMYSPHANTNACTANFGASAFTHTVPTGFNSGLYEILAAGNDKKIMMTSDDGTSPLYVEIENWDQANEEAWLWTKVSTIVSGTDTTLYLYYDPTQLDNTHYVGDTGSTEAANVWNSNFVGVWHMAQDPSVAGSPMKDSTGNSDRSTGGSMTSGDLINGLVGKAIDFDGGDDYVDIQSDVFDGLSSVTVSVIVKLDTYAASGQSPILVDRTGGTNDFQFIVLPDDNTPHKIQFSVWASVNGTARTSSDMPLNTWTHLTGRYISGSINVFVNGADNSFITDTVPTGGITSVSSVNRLAGDAYGNYLDGKICEFRMATVGLSDAWIKADYYNSDDSFVTFGAVESEPLFFIDGFIKEFNVAVVRSVNIYRRDTGALVDTDTSRASDGYYYLTTSHSGTHFIVAFDDDADDVFNAQVLDRITPGSI